MEVIGNYKIDMKYPLGKGSFGIVCVGRHRTGLYRSKSTKKLAIKILKKNTIYASQNIITKEIIILLKLTDMQHENVIALFDWFQNEHNIYLVMEYCNGGDFSDYLKAVGTLSEDTIRIFVKQLTKALHVLYKLNIIHRDLKPQNILLSYAQTYEECYPQPSEITLKIADFGLSKLSESSLTSSELCGTLIHMAPEMRSLETYDAKVDLWSLGNIIYACLSGRYPFDNQNPQLNVIKYIPLETSPELKSLIQGLLQYYAESRMCFSELITHPFLKNQRQ